MGDFFAGKFGYLTIGFGLLGISTAILVVLGFWKPAAFGALGLLGVIFVAILITYLSTRRLDRKLRGVRSVNRSVLAIEQRLEEVERRLMGTFDVERASRYESFIEVREQLGVVEAELLSLRETMASVFSESALVSEDAKPGTKAHE